VIYDNLKISLVSLLELYYEVINPTLINKQGNDVGSQYRTGIYYTDLEDTHIIKQLISKLQEKYDKPIVIEVKQLTSFYKAEEYH